MTFEEFVSHVHTLGSCYDLSITSWGRSKKHNAAVEGKPNSRHRLWLAVDIVLDEESDQGFFLEDCKRMGLIAVVETDHIHVQSP